VKILLISLVLFFTNLAEEKWKTLTDTTGKYTVEYPADWEVQEIGDRKALTTLLDDTNDTFAENINVISIPFIKTDVSQPAFEQGMVDQLKTQFKTFKYLGSTVKTLNGMKMLKVNYITDYEGIMLNLSQYLYSTESRLYVITVTVPEKGNPPYITLAEKVIGTLKVTK
jgi:hypothetical protein